MLFEDMGSEGLWSLFEHMWASVFPGAQNFSDLLVLSLGTGTNRTGYSAKDAAKWGALKWVLNNGSSPLLNSTSDASADMVDYNLSIMFDAHESGLNYLRIQVPSRSSWFVHWTQYSLHWSKNPRDLCLWGSATLGACYSNWKCSMCICYKEISCAFKSSCLLVPCRPMPCRELLRN